MFLHGLPAVPIRQLAQHRRARRVVSGRVPSRLQQADPDIRIEPLLEQCVRRLHDVIPACGDGQALPELLARARVVVCHPQRMHLHRQARGKAPGEQRRGEEQCHCRDAMSAADVKRKARLDEEEVVGKETQDGRQDRRPCMRPRSNHQYREHEHQRQILESRQPLGQRGCGHRGGSSQDRQDIAAAGKRRLLGDRGNGAV